MGFEFIVIFPQVFHPYSCLMLPSSPLEKYKTMMPVLHATAIVLHATAMGSKSIEVDGPLNYIVSCD